MAGQFHCDRPELRPNSMLGERGGGCLLIFKQPESRDRGKGPVGEK